MTCRQSSSGIYWIVAIASARDQL